MSNTNPFAAAIAAAAEKEDHTETQSGGFEVSIPEEGPTVLRFVSYIEEGKHDGGKYQGKQKPDAEFVRLSFELLSPKHVVTVDKEDGTQEKFGKMMHIRVKKSLSDKGRFKKLFDVLRRGRNNITHMAEMLGDAYVGTVTHNKHEDRTYANLTREDGSYSFAAPIMVDPMTGETKTIAVPEPYAKIQCFLWNVPTKEQWDSIYIDGTREVETTNAAGEKVKVQKSNNFLQESIMSARNFHGSPIHTLLEGIGGLNMESTQGAANTAQEVAGIDQATADQALSALNDALNDEIPF